MKYSEYINGEVWNKKSSNYLEENNICELCHKHKATNVHHTSYRRFGNEEEKDLMGLCDRCHRGIHDIPPIIDNERQLKKAKKIMIYFRKFPKLKTLVMNDISRKYFEGKSIIEVASIVCNETPFLVQNFLEIIYEKGKKENIDIIEETLAYCISKRIYASKNTKAKKKDLEDRTKKYESGETKYVKKTYENFPLKEETPDELIEEKIKKFCLACLSDRKVLSSVKSYMNSTFYDGKVYFNMVGAKEASDFYLKLKRDGLHIELFKALGGEY